MDVNNITVSGRLTADPVLKQAGEHQLGNFSIACNRRYGKTDYTSFFNCTAWSGTAKIVADYCKKGSLITVTGEIKQDRWEKDGKTMSTINIVVKEVILAPKSTGSKPAGVMDGGEDVSHDESKSFDKQQEFNDDDIPF